jgi:hypothetical protein
MLPVIMARYSDLDFDQVLEQDMHVLLFLVGAFIAARLPVCMFESMGYNMCLSGKFSRNTELAHERAYACTRNQTQSRAGSRLCQSLAWPATRKKHG